MNREILQGDVIANLKTLPDNLVDVIISSPPYWNLRNYNIEGQIGLEPDFRDYLNKMQTIMDELKRVLKGTGTCWINLGDCYGTHRSGDDNKGNSTEEGRKLSQESVKNYDKSRMGIPERFYINCIDSGWIARNHIVWTKNNSMPSSVKDRFKNSWESVFFFSKNKKYYFDLDAVRVPTITPTKPFNARVRDSEKQRYLQKATDEEIKNHNGKGEKYDALGKAVYDKSKPYAVVEREGTIYYRDLPPHDEIRKYLASARKDANLTIKELEKKLGVSAHHWFEDHTTPNSTYSYPTVQDWKKAKEILQFDDKYDFVMTTEYTKDAVKIDNPKGKNPGDVFQINTKPFPEAHFATFPPALPEKILKCSCPKQVCNKCGKPREVLKKSIKNNDRLSHTEQAEINKKRGMIDQTQRTRWVGGDAPVLDYEIIGYTDCGCNAGFKPGIVLDPFFGSGTVGLVAEQMGLRWCGIELNPEYIEIAKKRLAPFTSVEKLEAFV